MLGPASLLTLATLTAGPSAAPPARQAREALATAVAAGRWLQRVAITTPAGKVWPSDPADPKSVTTTLYGGTPGVVLFLLELGKASGDARFLADARAGADALLAAYAAEKDEGFYEGRAGLCFALMRAFAATGDARYDEGARDCVRLVRERARKAGAGVEWSDTTDIVAGNAGTALLLLHAARVHAEPADREVAVAAGRRLVEVAIKNDAGLEWAMDPRHGKRMPNFSHGTAGVAYLLATLYGETHEKVFLDAALAGGKYLISIADKTGPGCLVFHSAPSGTDPKTPFYKDVYYLGWCHGPVGTSRLFQRLGEVTGDRRWDEWVARQAASLLASGIPDKRTPGFWNNVGMCCGSAGVAEHALRLHALGVHAPGGGPGYLAFARRLGKDVLARATREGAGDAATARWVQAEHRVKPELLVAQTGFMQGAAGVGMMLLHLDAVEHGRALPPAWPDAPW